MIYALHAVILPWTVAVFLVTAAIIAVSRIPQLAKGFGHFPHLGKAVLIIAFLLGAYIRFTLVPDGHRILFDEDRYMAYAVSFARFGRAVSLEFATPRESIVGTPDQAIRVTVPVLQAIVFKLFGASEHNMFVAARLGSLLQIVLIAAVSWQFFKSILITTWVSALMALLPVSVYWSSSAGLDNYFVTFALLALCAVSWYAQKPTRISAIFAIVTTFILLCVRFEGFFFLPVLLGVLIILRKSAGKKTVSKKDLLAAVVFSVLVGVRALLSVSVLTKRWCCAEGLPLEAFSLLYTVRNLLPNLWSFVSKAEFPAVISILAFIALVRMKDRLVGVLGLWLLTFFAVYSSYYAGVFFTFEFSGSYGRYFLMLEPPLFLLSGIMAADLVATYKTQMRRGKALLSLLLVVSLVTLIPTVSRYRQMVSVSPYDQLVEAGPRTLHIFLEERVLPKVEKDAILIFPLTAYPLLTDHTVVYNDTFNKQPEVRAKIVEFMKSGKSAYILQTNNCLIFPQKCQDLESVFEFKPYLREGVNNTYFELDRLFLKEATDSAHFT